MCRKKERKTDENSAFFQENVVYTVEVPKSEQNTPEVDEAKAKEMKNLEDYGVFELVEDIGQESI